MFRGPFFSGHGVHDMVHSLHTVDASWHGLDEESPSPNSKGLKASRCKITVDSVSAWTVILSHYHCNSSAVYSDCRSFVFTFLDCYCQRDRKCL